MLPCALRATHGVRPGMSFSLCADPTDCISQSYELGSFTESTGRFMVMKFKKLEKKKSVFVTDYLIDKKAVQRHGWKK